MNLKLINKPNEDLGSREYLIKEEIFLKTLLFISSVFVGIWLSFSYFYLNINWVYGLFQTEIPSIVILALSTIIILFGVYSLLSIKNKSEIEICEYGLRLNDKKIFYNEISSISIKRGFVVKVIVETSKDSYIYRASKFTYKDVQAVNQVTNLISH